MGHFPVRYVCLPEGSMNWGAHYVAEGINGMAEQKTQSESGCPHK